MVLGEVVGRLHRLVIEEGEAVVELLAQAKAHAFLGGLVEAGVLQQALRAFVEASTPLFALCWIQAAELSLEVHGFEPQVASGSQEAAMLETAAVLNGRADGL